MHIVHSNIYICTCRKKVFQRTMGTSVFGRFHRLSETLDGKYELDDTLEEESSIEPHVMNEEEIMHKYWKIAVFHSVIELCTWILEVQFYH